MLAAPSTPQHTTVRHWLSALDEPVRSPSRARRRKLARLCCSSAGLLDGDGLEDGRGVRGGGCAGGAAAPEARAYPNDDVAARHFDWCQLLPPRISLVSAAAFCPRLDASCSFYPDPKLTGAAAPNRPEGESDPPQPTTVRHCRPPWLECAFEPPLRWLHRPLRRLSCLAPIAHCVGESPRRALFDWRQATQDPWALPAHSKEKNR
eukprot:SAG31_NODE_3496_length_4198_cov_5.708465_2_plen_206_part_00